MTAAQRVVAAFASSIGLGLLPQHADARVRTFVPPLVLTVRTVPAVAGASLVVDGTRGATSQADGVLTANISASGIHTVALILPGDDDRTHYNFVRWSDEWFSPMRQVQIHKNLTISAGLQVSYLTQLAFTDPAGNRVDPARISNVVLSGPDAEVVKLTYPYPPLWLHTPLPAKHMGDENLHVGTVPYAVSQVDYDGLNVSSQGQERYLPAPGGTWTVHLHLYRLSLRVRDALFGSGLEHRVRLTDPAGQHQLLRPDRDGRVSVVLGRGNYTAHALAAGISPLVPIALSRSQSVDVPVVTPLDLAVLVLIVLLAVTAVFAIGRGRHRLQSLARLVGRSLT